MQTRYNAARMSTTDRVARVAQVVESLEREMELLCVTGVEDKLQDNVRATLELLRNAGIKIWMLTGDKLETATCIAKSSRLVSRTQGNFKKNVKVLLTNNIHNIYYRSSCFKKGRYSDRCTFRTKRIQTKTRLCFSY